MPKERLIFRLNTKVCKFKKKDWLQINDQFITFTLIHRNYKN